MKISLFSRIAITLSLILSLTLSVSAESLLFLGDGCPHCTELDRELTKSNLYEKLDITKYEVYFDTESRNIYFEEANAVGYDGEEVPLLIDGDEYFVGTSAILEHLQAISLAPEPTLLTEEDSSNIAKVIEERESIDITQANRDSITLVLLIVCGLAICQCLRRRNR